MPGLVPYRPDDPASEANRAAWAVLAASPTPMLVAFSDSDPITGAMAPDPERTMPGAPGREHPVDRRGRALPAGGRRPGTGRRGRRLRRGHAARYGRPAHPIASHACCCPTATSVPRSTRTGWSLGPVGRRTGPAVEHRRAPGPLLPGVQQLQYTHIDPARAAGRPDHAGRARGRRPVRAAPGRVRARVDARDGDAARRPRRPAGGQVVARPAAACSRTRRPDSSTPGSAGAHHPRAVERGQSADHALAGDEDRPAVPVPALAAPRSSLTARRSTARATRASAARRRPALPELPHAGQQRPVPSRAATVRG